MNERDPISEWDTAIKSRLGTCVAVTMLFAFVCCLFAPIFGPIIKSMKRRQYVLYDDYEQRAEADMKPIRLLLWIVAIIGWIVVICCNLK